MNIVDSSVWIEYFIDTVQAENFAAAIEQTALLIVPALSFLKFIAFSAGTQTR